MSLLKQWQDLIGNQTDDSFSEFWEAYSDAETKIYTAILGNYKEKVSGKFEDLRAKYDVSDVLFMGFLDGIHSSLNNELNLEEIDAASQVELDIDFEKLYFNMHSAGADYLYQIPAWEMILTEERRMEIEKEYKKSKTVIKGDKIGRNDPCPCGSGKKYKKCCGQSA